MKLFIVAAMVTGAVLLAGCGKPKPTPVAEEPHATVPAAVDPAQKRAQELSRALKAGMTEADVARVAGEPKITQTASGSRTPVTWKYELSEGIWFVVRFDKSNLVTVAELENGLRIQ